MLHRFLTFWEPNIDPTKIGENSCTRSIADGTMSASDTAAQEDEGKQR